jgi:ASC-1-like (ASCH) protein
MTNQEQAQALLEEYNEMEDRLFQGGKAYQEIPENRWGDIEIQIEALGFQLQSPPHGYSTIKPE